MWSCGPGLSCPLVCFCTCSFNHTSHPKVRGSPHRTKHNESVSPNSTFCEHLVRYFALSVLRARGVLLGKKISLMTGSGSNYYVLAREAHGLEGR